MDYFNENINFAMELYKDKLKSAVSHAATEFSNIRAGRVNPAIIERVTVEYCGAHMPISDLATITNEDARTLVISPWDIAVRSEMCRALGSANLGANPIDNGQYIRMIFPQLTEDRRRDLVKQVKTIAESSRVTMRNERRDVMDKVRKAAKTDKFSEDELKGIETDIQKLLDDDIKNLDTILSRKEAEIMEI